MAMFSIEHSRAAYRADFAFYILLISGMVTYVAFTTPLDLVLATSGWVTAGLVLWTLVEYTMHRFLFHHIQPFKGWHNAHHLRPRALIYAPTWLIGGSIGLLVFWPTWALAGRGTAMALTLGFLVGNLAYSSAHHAVHHVRTRNRWLQFLKQWHAVHHHQAQRGVCFGVTSGFWDHVLGTTPARMER